MVLTEPSTFVSGFSIGAMVTLLVCFVWYLFLMGTGSVLTLAGIWAERFTDEELKTARKRGYIWGSVANIELGGFDIDHLVIAPGGTFALETKSHMARLDRARRAADLQQARDAARKASLVLRSKHVETPLQVTPVLVLWGRRNTADLPEDGRLVEGVHIVAVADLANWMRRHQSGDITREDARVTLQRLTTFRDTRTVREPALA
jgi:hypothetical protein